MDYITFIKISYVKKTHYIKINPHPYLLKPTLHNKLTYYLIYIETELNSIEEIVHHIKITYSIESIQLIEIIIADC